MYDDNESKVNWKVILKKVLIVVIIIIAILGIITLITKCSKNDDLDEETPIEVDLTEGLNQLEEATLKYLTKDNLPTTINASKTIRLKILINKDLTTDITDSAGNKCDTSNSYAEVTRLENNYAVKLSLTCGNNTDARVIYVGCFEECNGEVCKGSVDSLNGTCNEVTNETNDTTNVSGTTTSNSTTSSSSNTTSTSTSHTTSNSTTITNTNNNSNTTTSNTSTTNKNKYVTYYEYTKCSSATTCASGTYDESLGKCVSSTLKVLEGKVVATTSPSTTKEIQTDATLKSSQVDATYVGIVSTTKPATIQNTTTIGYIYKNYSSSKYYYYKYSCSTGTIVNVNGTYKCETTTPTCTSGTLKNINGVYKCVTTQTVAGTTTYSCQDSSYYYSASSNKCIKNDYVYTYTEPVASVCRTVWSASSSLAGWTKTGNTEVRSE